MEPLALDKDTGKPCTGNRLAFVTENDRRVLIAIYNMGLDDAGVDAEIRAIKSLHEASKLRLCEAHVREKRAGRYACDVPADVPVFFMSVDPYTDITAPLVSPRQAEGWLSCTALDLIYILGFATSSDELLSFVEYYSTLRRFQTVSLDGMSGLYLLWKSANYSIEQGAIEYDHVLVPPGVSDQHVFEYYTKTLVDYPFGLKYRLFANPLGWIVEEGGFGYSCFSHKGCLGFSGQGKMLGPSSFVFLAHNVELFSQEDLTPETRNALVVVDELNQRLFCRHKEQLGRLPFLHGKVLQVLFMPMKYARGVDHSGFTLDKKKEYVYSDAYVDADVIVIKFS